MEGAGLEGKERARAKAKERQRKGKERAKARLRAVTAPAPAVPAVAVAAPVAAIEQKCRPFPLEGLRPLRPPAQGSAGLSSPRPPCRGGCHLPRPLSARGAAAPGTPRDPGGVSPPRPLCGTTGTLGARALEPFERTRPRTDFRGSVIFGIYAKNAIEWWYREPLGGQNDIFQGRQTRHNIYLFFLQESAFDQYILLVI